MIKSFLKWAGGKSQSLNKLDKYFYDHLEPFSQRNIAGTFIEPFVGSGVVFMNTEADQYIINDINEDLINIYRILQADFVELAEMCRELFIHENNKEDRYYELRAEFNKCDVRKNPLRKAALFLYLNKHGFNGLCRYNSTGIFNVPYGKYDKVKLPFDALESCYKKMSRVHIMNESFDSVVKLATKNDLVYMDPPYVPMSATSSFTSYTTEGFSVDQQQLIAELAESSPAKVLISNHDNEVTRELYKNADQIVEIEVTRYISADKDSRKPVKELLAIYRNQ